MARSFFAHGEFYFRLNEIEPTYLENRDLPVQTKVWVDQEIVTDEDGIGRVSSMARSIGIELSGATLDTECAGIPLFLTARLRAPRERPGRGHSAARSFPTYRARPAFHRTSQQPEGPRP